MLLIASWGNPSNYMSGGQTSLTWRSCAHFIIKSCRRGLLTVVHTENINVLSFYTGNQCAALSHFAGLKTAPKETALHVWCNFTLMFRLIWHLFISTAEPGSQSCDMWHIYRGAAPAAVWEVIAVTEIYISLAVTYSSGIYRSGIYGYIAVAYTAVWQWHIWHT